MNKAYQNLIQKLMIVINKLAPSQFKQVKGNSQKWLDGDVVESKSLQNKLCRKFNCSKFNVDKEIYSKAHNKSHKLILQKKYSTLRKIKDC